MLTIRLTHHFYDTLPDPKPPVAKRLCRHVVLHLTRPEAGRLLETAREYSGRMGSARAAMDTIADAICDYDSVVLTRLKVIL